MEMNADKAEGAPARGAFPRPTDNLVVAVNAGGQERMDFRGRFDKIETVIELVIDTEVLHPRDNRVRAVQDCYICFQNFVFALRTAASAAEQIDLALDVLFVLRADGPVQGHDPA